MPSLGGTNYSVSSGDSKSTVAAIAPVQPGLGGAYPVVESEGRIHHVYFSSNRGLQHNELRGQQMRTYIEHCLHLLNTLHHHYVEKFSSTLSIPDFHNFDQRKEISWIAAFEREIALFVYRQCFRKVSNRITKKSRGYYTVGYLDQGEQSSSSDPGIEDGHASTTTAIRIADLFQEKGTSDQIQSPGFTIPDRRKDWIINPLSNDVGTFPSDDNLFFLYTTGLELSKATDNSLTKDWFEDLFIELGGNDGCTSVQRVLEKAGKLSQAVENLVRYALRRTGSTPDIPWNLKFEFIPPIGTEGKSPCVTMNGNTLVKLYAHYNIRLQPDMKATVWEWGEFSPLHDEHWVEDPLVHAEALRDVDHHKFHTQGGHERIYGTQWYPAPTNCERKQDTVPVLEEMVRCILLDILATVGTEPIAGLSDSTGESGGGSGSE
ncbi:hypothetical protein V8D89_001386 [Ganoderma adspersum]